MTSGTIRPMPGKRTNKEYTMQGWNARREGHPLTANPYYETSTAAKLWAKGWAS